MILIKYAILNFYGVAHIQLRNKGGFLNWFGGKQNLFIFC